MYERYGRAERGTFVRASMDDAPLPPPTKKAAQKSPSPPLQTEQPPKYPPQPPSMPHRPPELMLGKGILEALHLEDLDTGDLLLLFLLFFLMRQQADEELLIAIGLLLIL